LPSAATAAIRPLLALTIATQAATIGSVGKSSTRIGQHSKASCNYIYIDKECNCI
jgi:hypothetical protein